MRVMESATPRIKARAIQFSNTDSGSMRLFRMIHEKDILATFSSVFHMNNGERSSKQPVAAGVDSERNKRSVTINYHKDDRVTLIFLQGSV